MRVHRCARVCTRFIADFIACDMREKHVSHACGVELVANLYRTQSMCLHTTYMSR